MGFSKLKKLITTFLLLFCLLFFNNIFANTGSWIDKSPDTAFGNCVELPKVTQDNFDYHNGTLTVSSSDWIKTPIQIQKNKPIKFEWNIKNVIAPSTTKYKLLYRIDPRFPKPQIFIKKYDKVLNQYVSDFHEYKNDTLEGGLTRYHKDYKMDFPGRVKDFVDYFNFIDRDGIFIPKNRVVSIKMIKPNSFFTSDEDMQINSTYLNYIYHDVPQGKNSIIYSNIDAWCRHMDKDKIGNDRLCHYRDNQAINYGNADDMKNMFIGMPFVDNNITSIDTCNDFMTEETQNTPCRYTEGKGMDIYFGGKAIKNSAQNFMAFNDSSFFYYITPKDGYLQFTSDILPIKGMFDLDMWYWTQDNGYTKSIPHTEKQLMQNWSFKDYESFENEFNKHIVARDGKDKLQTNAKMNFIHFGSYAMEIEVGDIYSKPSMNDVKNLRFEYGVNDSWFSWNEPKKALGSFNTKSHITDIAADSYYQDLWIRVAGGENLQGQAHYTIQHYKGKTFFANLIYRSIVNPVQQAIKKSTQTIYAKLIGNASVMNIANSVMVLYVMYYVIVFVIGKQSLKASEILNLILKFTLISVMFNKDISWKFFGGQAFDLFIKGGDYIASSVVGTGSGVDMFGFIDQMVFRYINPKLWLILIIQSLNIMSGLFVLSAIVMYSSIICIKAILEVVITYCISFIVISVLLSLAPFFVILILFERTRSMFDNWITLLFSYGIKPTVLIVFFLLLDRIISLNMENVVTRLCPGILIQLYLGLDLNYLGIPWAWSIKIPGLIPGLTSEINNVPDITSVLGATGTLVRMASSVLIYFTIAQCMGGLGQYVESIVGKLAGPSGSRDDGKSTSDVVTSDLKKYSNYIMKYTPVGTAVRAAKSAKRIFVDGKLSNASQNNNNDNKSDNNKDSQRTVSKELAKAQNDEKSAGKNLKSAQKRLQNMRSNNTTTTAQLQEAERNVENKKNEYTNTRQVLDNLLNPDENSNHDDFSQEIEDLNQQIDERYHAYERNFDENNTSEQDGQNNAQHNAASLSDQNVSDDNVNESRVNNQNLNSNNNLESDSNRHSSINTNQSKKRSNTMYAKNSNVNLNEDNNINNSRPKRQTVIQRRDANELQKHHKKK